MEIIEIKRKISITRSNEFAKKKLATHALNVGLLCGHGCLYCSTPALMRTQQKIFYTFIASATAEANNRGCSDIFNILAYDDGNEFSGDDHSVIWLKKSDSKSVHFDDGTPQYGELA